MANELEFSSYEDGDSWVEVSGYNEIHQNSSKDVYYLDSSTHGVSTSGNYTLREDMGTYYATEVGGGYDQYTPYYEYSGYEYSTNLTGTDGLTSIGSVTAQAVIANARLQDVDLIMVRDETLTVNITGNNDDEQIWQSLHDADVDFYADMSDIYRSDSQVITGLGAGTLDTYGNGYDVQTSAQVDEFGDDRNLRVYYDGKHTDFIDTNDTIDTSTPGEWEMETGNTENGSTWADEVSANTSGGGGSFFIVVGGKKIAVKHSDGEWVADNTALSVAQGVGSDTIQVNYDGRTEAQFISYVADRYGLSDNLTSSDI